MKATKDLYFEKPTQVAFKEDESVCDDPIWTGGIAYRDEIICGVCGHVVSMADVDEIEVFDSYWVDISYDIKGDWEPDDE